MKVWERARADRHCGLCAGTIVVGEPVLARWIAGHGWKSLRCANCAGERVPELPPLDQVVPRAVPRTPIQPMLAVASLARDWKASALAEREPGEDG